MMKKIIAIIIFITARLISTAQDPHFTQFANAPQMLNPALTGNFGGTARLNNSYRTQWSALGDGYKTLHFSGDAPVGKKGTKNNFFGVGAMIVQDKAGIAGFKSTFIEGSISYTTAIDPNANHYFALGFQAGLNQQSLDLTKSTWDSQWNGDLFDPALSSGESIQLQQLTWLDFNTGVLYYFFPDDGNFFNLGASYSHIGGPDISFYTNKDYPLSTKITVHSGAEIKFNKSGEEWIVPKALYSQQGVQKEILAGAYYKRKVQFKSKYTNYKKEAYFYVGGFYRLDDAFCVAARIEFNTLGLGFSYDVNTSSLSKMAGASNAFELNLSFISFVKRGNKAKTASLPRYF